MNILDKVLGIPNSAVLIVSMQDVLVTSIVNRDIIVDSQLEIIKRAKSLGIPIIFSKKNNQYISNSSIIQEFLPYLKDFILLERSWSSCFNRKKFGDLERVLDNNEIRHLFIMGLFAESCFRETYDDAIKCGYEVSTGINYIGTCDNEFSHCIFSFGSKYYIK